MTKAFPISLLLAGTTLATALALDGAARAQSSISISMTAPPATPRLQVPFVFAAMPATPFVFAVPATGQAPLTFSATGLPAGLTLAAATGIISGTMPAEGSYPVSVTVTNAAGSANATYTLVSGSTLGLTPPMGWNSYDSFGASVTEQDMVNQAEAVRTHLQPFGWNYVVIDYRWYEPGQPIDANGRYLPATSKYPSATGSTGMQELADQIHAIGLGFGIHIMRGVPRKSYDADLPIAGSEYTTQDAGNPDDPCPWDTHMWGVRGDTPAGQAWYDALFEQYASWGIDFVKIDDMLNNTTRVYHQAEADAIRSAIDKSGRSIVLSFSPGPDDPSWLPNSSANLNTNPTMWRVVNDFWDYEALTDLPGVFSAANTWQGVDGLSPGHWADLDMLPLGYLGPRNEWHDSGQTTFTNNEQVTILSLWSILPSPLMFGGNPERLDSDAWTLALLTNEEVLAVNQDALGARGRRTAVTGGEAWVRDLSGGRKAVAFFNRGAQDADMSLTFSQIGVTGMPVIRDLWRRADVTGMADALSASVPGRAALLYTVSPPGMGGSGGTGAAGGAAGNGPGGSSGAAGSVSSGGTSTGGVAVSGSSGMTAMGGASGATTTGGASGGTSPAGGTSAGGASGGAAATSGGSGTAAAGGSTSTGGAFAGAGGVNVSGGTSPGGGGALANADNPGGCACALGERRPTPAPFVLCAGVALAALRLRRAVRRRRPPQS